MIADTPTAEATREAVPSLVPAVELRGITKRFGSVVACDGVDLEVQHGEIHGLLGQNGAGKSTLMNIIGGNLMADVGTMRLGGAPYAPANARDAERHGIAFIHQELNLFSNLSIAENIFIGAMPRGVAGLIDRRALRRRAAELLNQVDLDLAPDTLVERLAPGERQLVELVRRAGRRAASSGSRRRRGA